MKAALLLVFLNALLAGLLCTANEQKHISKITVVGTVYCDTCSNTTFSKHSYFLPGVGVQVECKFKANSSKGEQITLSLNKTTDKYGIYKFDIPFFDGFGCREGRLIGSLCHATLVQSSSTSCNIPGTKASTKHMQVKSKQAGLCICSLNALNYLPPKRDLALCGVYKEEILASSLNSSEFFLPFFPPFGLPWWPLPPLPPLPFPFPPIPFLPNPPSLPFPFPPLPPLSSFFFPSPPPPPFCLNDPRTWYPFHPPSPPVNPQKQQP